MDQAAGRGVAGRGLDGNFSACLAGPNNAPAANRTRARAGRETDALVGLLGPGTNAPPTKAIYFHIITVVKLSTSTIYQSH